jgi:hypothetical protein
MAQFGEVPPIECVSALFAKATGKKLSTDVAWTLWQSLDSTDMEWLFGYIRPCHQKLLIETISGKQKTPLSLLRQLLRPHNLRIQTETVGWSVQPQKTRTKTVGIMPGVTVIWTEGKAAADT